MKNGRTIGAVLLDRLAADPDAEACRLVAADGTWEPVTVARLMRKAMAYAGHFGAPAAGRNVIAVSLYHGLDLHAAFLGGLLSGHIPTMVAPPSPRMDRGKYADSFAHMLRHIDPGYLVIDGTVSAELDRLALRDIGAGGIVDPSSIGEASSIDLAESDPSEPALIQHSSGTTGFQKGVALSHHAVLTHNRVYADRLGLSCSDVIVSWLPLYHDMGLIACFLLPLLEGVRFVEISPFDWVRRPAMLLEQMHEHRGTLCWLPNFAYAFMVDAVRDSELAAGIDLSRVRAWVNCSEPVYHSSHAAFLGRFGRLGVREDQLTASYAMAENVFAVTQSAAGGYRTLSVNRETFAAGHRAEPDTAAGGQTFVSNGKPLEGTEIAIGAPALAAPPGQVGEILIRGRHRFDGYFRRADLTATAIDDRGWFHTGDLGFLFDGELYVTGRKKDLIIIQGRNFYPSDIEQIVGRVEGVDQGRVVAFGLADEALGTERLIVLAEAAVDVMAGKRLALAIRSRLAQELDCTPGDVRVVPPRWLIKSTSGKPARADIRRKYLQELAGEDAPP